MLLSKAVGPGGRVYATDLQPEMLDLIRRKIESTRTSNVEVVLGTPTESRLPDRAIDLALMVDVYHELAQPQAFLRSLKRALQPDGRLVLIELRKENWTVASYPVENHGFVKASSWADEYKRIFQLFEVNLKRPL